MTRKAFLTGILMFLKKGSLFQLAIAMVVCAGYLSASAWYQPYRTRSINIFKVGTELALLFTLMCVSFCSLSASLPSEYRHNLCLLRACGG